MYPEENRRRYEDEGSIEVILIAGLINATGKMLYWKIEIDEDDEYLRIGNHAIVENGADYDLIKIEGIIKTTKEGSKRFSHTSYENMKRVKTIEILN